MLLIVAEAGDAVFAPPVGATSGLLMGKIGPGVAIVTVILAHRSPLAFAQIGSPTPPFRLAVIGFHEPPMLCRHILVLRLPGPLCLSEIRSGHIGDAAHPGQDGRICGQPAQPRHIGEVAVSSTKTNLEPIVFRRDEKQSVSGPDLSLRRLTGGA